MPLNKETKPNLNIWLPNSPDCNSIDNYITAEWESNKTLSNTNNELKARIMAAFINLNKETTGKVCKAFWSCLETVVEVNGDFFE